MQQQIVNNVQAEQTTEQGNGLSKIAVVTGANSGLGFEVTKALIDRGLCVVMACRSHDKSMAAIDQLHTLYPDCALDYIHLDLADLSSVKTFADTYLKRYNRLDILCNNAGVMALPYCKTADGFEMQFGTNHLGHFALSGLLFKCLLATQGARVVTVTSLSHWWGRIDLQDLHGQKRYRRWAAYTQSKLANLLFCFELQRRFEGLGASAISVACHPGYASSNLHAANARMTKSRIWEKLWAFYNAVAAQSAARGALPTIYAATAPDVKGGDVFGPRGLFELWGLPTKVRVSKQAQDQDLAKQLWQISEELTGIFYDAEQPDISLL